MDVLLLFYIVLGISTGLVASTYTWATLPSRLARVYTENEATEQPMTSQPTVTLRRGQSTQDLSISQVTTDILRRLFRVDPNEAWLKDDIDDTPYFPDDSGKFNLHEVNNIGYATLLVEGPLAAPSTNNTSVSRAVTPTGNLSLLHAQGPSSSLQQSPPTWRSVTRQKKAASCTLKVTRAAMTMIGHTANFKLSSVAFIELVDGTANLGYISTVIKNKWGEDCVIVTNEGLRLEDSSATQGLNFWKSPRRKLYAVSINDVRAAMGEPSDNSRKRSCPSEWNENAADAGNPLKRQLEDTESKLDYVMSDLLQIKETFEQTVQLTKDTPIPVGLKKSIKDNFKCRLCLTSPLNPPIVITKCCRVILGCEPCINGWFVGDDALTKCCPSCRVERGYSEVMVLRGLDDFLTTIKCLQEVNVSQE